MDERARLGTMRSGRTSTTLAPRSQTASALAGSSIRIPVPVLTGSWIAVTDE